MKKSFVIATPIGSIEILYQVDRDSQARERIKLGEKKNLDAKIVAIQLTRKKPENVATGRTNSGPLIARRGLRALNGQSQVALNGAHEDLPQNVRRLANELKEYFDGRRKSFSTELLPVGTKFQTQVWREMARIPYGQTLTYGELAKRVGKPGAARAVGNVCNKNPYLIVVPCHRVVGANGGLGDFAHSLQKKRFLLDLESISN